MKCFVLVAVALATLAVYGEEPQRKAAPDKEKASAIQQTDSGAGRTVILVNQPAPGGEQGDHAQKSPSYLSRLFSPENIPNIALVFVAGVTALFILYQSGEMK